MLIASTILRRIWPRSSARLKRDRYLMDEPHWQIKITNAKRNLPRFFEALSSLTSENSILCLNSASPRDELKEVLKRISVDRVSVSHPDPETWITKEDDIYYISINSNSLQTLAEWSERSAAPEIAHDIAVFDKEGTILEWFDVPDDPISVTTRIDEDTITRFANAAMGRFDFVVNAYNL